MRSRTRALFWFCRVARGADTLQRRSLARFVITIVCAWRGALVRFEFTTTRARTICVQRDYAKTMGASVRSTKECARANFARWTCYTQIGGAENGE